MAAAKDTPVTKREIFGWCCYDFSNSAFTTVIVTVVFSIFFTKVIAAGSEAADSLWGTAQSISQLIVIATSSILGAIADATATKKKFLTFTGIGLALFTAALYFTGPGTIAFAIAAFVAANVFFSLGEIFCASFLPELSTSENMGKISGYGWSFGYVGGLLSLALCLLVVPKDLAENPEKTRLAFLITAGFIVAGLIPTVLFLKERAVPKPGVGWKSAAALGFTQLKSTFMDLPKHRTLAVFFLAFTLYMSGLSAVVVFAGIFAERVLSFQMPELIVLFIALQVSSSLGAFLLGFLQDRMGSLTTLTIAIVLWIVVCVASYFCTTKGLFFVIGNIAGLAIGSTQSASRAVVGLLVPPGKSAEVFSFWGVFARVAVLIGSFTFGVLSDAFGIRTAILANGGFFVLGLGILFAVRLHPRQEHSETVSPAP
jgi:UMF1 family MFS transporter